MHKFLAFILILIIAPILGSIYGIIHDQITYTISTEYYTKFKFIQFGLENLGENIGTDINPEIQLKNPRLGAGIVGLMATWWVGMFIGIILAIVGLTHRNGKEMFISTIKAFILTVIIALFTGFFGFIYGKIFSINNTSSLYLPKNTINIDNFIIVGSIHNFSYLGGLIGLIIGIVYSFKQRRRYKV